MDHEDNNQTYLTANFPESTEEPVKPYRLYWQYAVYLKIFTFVPPILIGLGTIGNVLAIVVLLSREMRAYGVSIILTVLAMADLCLLYTSTLRFWIFFMSDGALDVRAFNIHTCRMHMFFTYLGTQLSPMILALMTVERAISVCAPLRARQWCSRGNTIKALAGLIAFLVCFNLTNFFAVTFEHKLKNRGHSCYFYDHVMKIYYIINTVFSSFIPFVVMLFGNGLIIYKLVRAARRSSKMAANEGSSNLQNTSIMLVAISIFFLITNVPYSVYVNGLSKYWPVTTKDQAMIARSGMAYAILSQISMLNNCLNFVFYCVIGKAFRKAFSVVILRRSTR